MAKKKKVKEEVAEEVVTEEVVEKAPALPSFAGLKDLVGQLNKHYKADVIRQGSDIPKVYKIPFDEPILDYVSDGGIPIGRLTEAIGIEHSGKTLNALKSMRSFQRYCFNCHTPDSLKAVWKHEEEKTAEERGFPALKSISCSCCDKPKTNVQAFIDYEGTSDPKFIKRMGVDVNGIIYTRPDLPSTAVDTVDIFLRNPLVGLIVFDSVGALGSDKEVGNAIVDDKMNQNALFLNKATRKWQNSLNMNNQVDVNSATTMIVINQSYSSIGHFVTEVAQGGRGLRHGKGMSLKTSIIEKVYKNQERTDVLGVHIRIENTKNKTGIPYRRGEYYLNLDESDPIGYCESDKALQLMDIGIRIGVLEQRGAWIYFGEDKWNGKTKFLEDFREDWDVQQVIKKAVYDKLGE